MKPITFAGVLALILLSACFPARWEGFVYPNKSDSKAHVNIGSFRSLERCQASALEALNKVSSLRAGKYECGLDCEPQTDTQKPRICEKTVP
jgi:hypothetical protein